jgi:RNA polymerase sigma-70 factor (ECF subfamily)
MDTPASLLERLRQPAEREAWTRFVKLYTPLLFSWARRVGLQEQDAADLVQDVFAVLIQKLPDFSYDQRRSFRSWLRTVTLNKWREAQRRRAAVQRSERLYAEPEPLSPDVAEAFWEAEYRQHLVAQALQLMQTDFHPTTWQACWEHVVSGKSAAEVAAQLGISPGAVRAAKFRVLGRLRRELDQLLD